ncbi:SRPBCC family protein [Streptomyces sp. HNM0574]|uniref:SRPBCC family protein n=1 Tax=Streptomyces sp. HNM0574 TaxID=2714954 RepID=UPI00146A72DA|nr:SRPBCC family protein [Streptomyces sp. HNM0574]NLU68181.1 SRPBCC family protein [Streptomyces sp. HNM0574]
MARQLRSVELGFAESAPVRLTFTAEVSAPPGAVYVSLAEDVTDWPRWFDAVLSAEPTGEGRGRRVRLRGGIVFDETILAATADERYAYRIDTTTAPGVTAMAEDWQLSPSGTGGTLVRWTMAVDGPAPVRMLLKLARPGVGKSFRDAMRGLDRLLSARA